MGLPKVISLPDPSFRNCGPCDVCEARELSFCAALETGDIHHLARILTIITAESGAVLFHEGDDAKHVYNVTSGCIKLHKMLPDGRLQIIGFMFEGDYLGMPRTPEYRSTAQAVDDAKLCRFRLKDFQTLSDDHPELGRRLFEMARTEIDAAGEHMLLLGRKTAKERLASFLLHLSAGQSRRGRPSNPVSLPMSRGDIADYLGLTIETVSRTFTSFRKSGLIDLPDKSHAFLKDPDSLMAIAENE
ncbi:MAG: helix-turn-helix domain-containing protein [Rhodospirillales bacterium]